MLKLTAFSASDIRAFEPELKIGLLATVSPEGLPHVTLISSLAACSPTQVVWGQFTEGLSKQYIRQNPKAGWLIMSLQKELWRGTATFRHTRQAGPEYERYNNQPMFRYNAYFGIHTVYYMDLVEHTGRQPLPMKRVIAAAVLTMWVRALRRLPVGAVAINRWTWNLLNKLDNLKFVAYVAADGYPRIIPVIQAQPLGRQSVIFSLAAYGEELREIPKGATVAVFGMALSMEDVLLRGEYQGVRRVGLAPCGIVDVNWVYNPMPPAPGQIYPRLPLEPITAF